MFECIMAWILLFAGIARNEPEWFIASGVFAVALQIEMLRKGER